MKYRQRDLREVEEKVSYNLNLPAQLYEEIRKFAQTNRQSIALTIQNAIEEYFERCRKGA
jgi:hypothetical protein